jgi:hypothetical protein
MTNPSALGAQFLRGGTECAATLATFFSLWLRRLPLVIVLVVLDVVLKIRATWKAGHQKQLAWFICLWIFNTCGIPPLIYLLRFQKKGK